MFCENICRCNTFKRVLVHNLIYVKHLWASTVKVVYQGSRVNEVIAPKEKGFMEKALFFH